MNCPRCSTETMVIDTRLGQLNTIRRRRECIACSHRFSTWETRAKPANNPARQAYKKAYDAQRYRNLTDDQKQELKLRRQAREEARLTNVPVAQIFDRWNAS